MESEQQDNANKVEEGSSIRSDSRDGSCSECEEVPSSPKRRVSGTGEGAHPDTHATVARTTGTQSDSTADAAEAAEAAEAAVEGGTSTPDEGGFLAPEVALDQASPRLKQRVREIAYAAAGTTDSTVNAPVSSSSFKGSTSSLIKVYMVKPDRNEEVKQKPQPDAEDVAQDHQEDTCDHNDNNQEIPSNQLQTHTENANSTATATETATAAETNTVDNDALTLAQQPQEQDQHQDRAMPPFNLDAPHPTSTSHSTTKHDIHHTDRGLFSMAADMAAVVAPPRVDVQYQNDNDQTTWTRGRKLAKNLSQYSWYYPQNTTSNNTASSTHEPPPSLDAAWAYFEHVTLPRHFVNSAAPANFTAREAPPPDEDHLDAEQPETRQMSRGLPMPQQHPTMKPTSYNPTTQQHQQSSNSNKQTRKHKHVDQYEKSSPGETSRPTTLYSVLSTPAAQLADFGIGVGLYFDTLKIMGLLLILAGLMSLPNVVYYRKAGGFTTDGQLGVKGLLKGSAICTNVVWKACPTCQPKDYKDDVLRFATAPLPSSQSNNDNSTNSNAFTNADAINVNSDANANSLFTSRQQPQRQPQSQLAFANINNDNTLKFVKTNACQIGLAQGIDSWITTMFLFLTIFGLGYMHRKKTAVKLDEIQLTSSDYSVEVCNPPRDAYDPKEWRDFFTLLHPTIHVRACTVVIDNEILVQALIQRRTLLLQLSNMLPFGVPSPLNQGTRSDLIQCLESLPPTAAWKKLLLKPLGPVYMGGQEGGRMLIQQILEQTSKIRAMLQKETYAVSRVFLTFETERAQRLVLSKLTVAKRKIVNNDVRGAFGDGNERARKAFRGVTVLNVREPAEPDSIRWQDLDESPRTKLLQKTFTYGSTIICITLCGVLISFARQRSSSLAAFAISFLNCVVPVLCTALTELESHDTEGRKQRSNYFKVVLFRWMNTAIVMAIITPFTSTVRMGEGNLMGSVYAIFVAEILTVPVFQLSDVMGNINRHVLGPRAVDQRRMNLYFQGTPYQLAERYTNITKILFFCFFYAAVFPSAFFFTAAILLIHYFLDKFSLLRSWTQGPPIGARVAQFSHTYFFPLVILTLAVMSNYQWSGFPYDNSCAEGTTVSQQYIGNHTAYTQNGQPISIQIVSTDQNYKFCNQDLRNYQPAAFPAFPRFQPEGSEWMTVEQAKVAKLFGWTVVGILVIVTWSMVSKFMDAFVFPFFHASYKPSGEDLGKSFSEVREIFAYVPQVRVPGFNYPLLACDVTHVDPELVGWTDPMHDFDYHNLIHDVAVSRPRGEEELSRPFFSIVREWSPASEVVEYDGNAPSLAVGLAPIS